jgi:uncharacterized protein YlaI
MLYIHSFIFSLHDKRRERIVNGCGINGEKIKMCEKQKELTESEKKVDEMVDGWKMRTFICEECTKSIDPAKDTVYTFDYKYVFCSAGCRFEWEREHGVNASGQIETGK